MALQVDWHGVFPAVPTQYHEDLSLDLVETRRHIEALIDEGVHGLVMLGTIGENCSNSPDEKKAILQAAVEVSGGRVPVISGIAEYTTRGACETSQMAEEVGVNGLMVMPGMVYKADAREAAQHLRSVAESTRLPIMCYNNPPVYRVDLTPEVFTQLLDVENIVCIKEASGDVPRVTDLYNAFGDRFVLFAGLDNCCMESQLLGCRGWISGLVDAFPKENRMMWDAFEAGDFARAVEIYRWYMPMLHFDSHPKLVQYIKLACAEMGFGTERVRPPRLTLVGEEREKALGIIRNCAATRPE